MGAALVWLPIALAPFIGSFLGVLVLRLPAGRDIVWSRSRCESCGHVLAPSDLVPILSFLALRGRCRCCAAPIARFHLGVELAAVAVAIWAAGVEADPAWLWADCALGWTLLALAWIDLRHFLLPDALTLPLVLAGLAATWLLDPAAITDHAAGAALGYLVLRSVELAYRAWRHRDGLGQGDAKLMAAAGAWVGWQPLPQLLVAAALAGIALALLRRRRGEGFATIRIPFGPCIAASLWITRLYLS